LSQPNFIVKVVDKDGVRTVNEAIGVSVFPWLILMLTFLLNDVPQRVGNSLKAVYTNIVVFGFVAYAAIMETKHAALSVKILASFGLSHGLFLLFTPNFHAQLWGNVQDDNDFLFMARRSCGSSLLGLSVYLWALIGDVHSPRALGFHWGTVLFAFAMLLGDLKRSKFDMKLIYTWMLAMAFFAVTLSIQIPEKIVVATVEEGVKTSV
jgi:hypothetical protein